MATKPVPVRLSEVTLARLDAAAAKSGESRSGLIVRLIEEGLGASRGTDATTAGTAKAAEPAPVKAKPKPVAEKVAAVKRIAVPKVKSEPVAQAQASAPTGDGISENQRAVRALHLPPPERPAYGSMLKKPKPARR